MQVITLVDLAGHERYFKTTAYGLTGHLPDYACLIVGANAGGRRCECWTRTPIGTEQR